MKIVAQMLIRNEADIIYETLIEITKWVRDVVILDGASNDGTLDEIRRFIADTNDSNIYLTSEPDPAGEFHDHIRNHLLGLTLELRPDWIISVDADEIYHTNPVDAIFAADTAKANVVRCMVPEFWLTQDDLNHRRFGKPGQSPQWLRRWYSWGHMGTFIWKPLSGHYYPNGIPKRTPELPEKTWREWQVAGPVLPICKHYAYRSLDQINKRREERQERGGRKYFGKYFLNSVIDENAARLRYLADGQTEFDTTYTHGFVHEAMKRQ